MARRSFTQIAIAALLVAVGSSAALAQSTAITYQGQLKDGGSVVNSPSDFRFSLFTAESGGTQVGSTVTQNAVAVTDGLFTTPVDFGVNPYTSNQNLFLQIEVRNPAGVGSFIPMGTRQLLTPAPFSLATRGINVDAAGDIALLTGIDRRISVANPPLNANGTNLTILAGNANSFGLATDGGDLVLEAGRARNSDQPFVRPGDVFIRTGGNQFSATNAPNGGDIIMQTGGAFGAITERVRVTQSGNVGIGTVAPIAKLEIQGPVSGVNDTTALVRMFNCGAACGQEDFTEGLRLLNESPNGRMGLGFLTGGSTTINTVPSVWIGTNNGSNPGDGSNDFVVATKTSPTTLTPRMTVNGDNGNVGIGTDNPQARLHNVGTTRLDGSLQFGADLQNGNTLRWGRFDGGPGSTLSTLDISPVTVPNSSAFAISRNGSQVFLFQLDGVAAKIGGGAWAVLSDERSKNDIQPMTGTLDRLLKLKGHAYTYKPEFVEDGRALPGTQIGLVAQEVETVFPDWVTTGSDGLKQVTERSTTALMVEALRDLRTEKNTEIANLKARLEKLEAMLTSQAK